MSINLPAARKSDIVIQEVGDEILIYDLIGNKAFSLNHTSAMIWQLCDGTKTVAEIARNMTGRLDSVITEDFVWLALEQLKRDNLLEKASEITIPFQDLSRRDVIRKVGLASLAALPVIASLAAPAAAQAQSCAATNKANGCTCSANANCASGCCGTSGTAIVCVAINLDAQGAACRSGCECISNCCVGGVCQNGEIPSGSGTCTTACQCASNSCNTATGICN